MKKAIIILLCVLVAAAVVGCGAMEKDFSEIPSGTPIAPGDSGELAGGDVLVGEDGEPKDQEQGIPAGQLTAAEWDDLKDYDFWLSLINPGQEEKGGIFNDYYNQWGLATKNLVPVRVVSGEAVVPGAKVTLRDYESSELLYTAVTDAKGIAYLFPPAAAEKYNVKAESGKYEKTVTVDYVSGMEAAEIELPGYAAKLETIELMMVIDTTGSMGDEILYIRSELIDVVKRAQEFTGAEIKLSILLYRDDGDDYVTKYYDFSKDLDGRQTDLNKVYASGGGDYPEAVDKALAEAVEKQWSSANTTKLIFHVLDAPPHSAQQNKTRFCAAVKKAAEKGIRLIPVASSGVDKLTEFLLRSEAIMTGGTYTFLTDDSGIGNPHLAPTTGEFVVEFLNEMLLRLIKEYYTGTETAPVPYSQQQN